MSNETTTGQAEPHSGNESTDGNEPPIDGVEEKLRTLFYALLNHFRGRVGPDFSVTQLHDLVLSVLKNMNVGEEGIAWEDAAPATLPDCKRHANLHLPLRVPATVAEVHDPALVSVCGSGGQRFEVATISARFVDRAGNSMWSLDITGEELIDRVQMQFRRGGPAELLCVPVALPVALNKKNPVSSLQTARREFFLHLADLRPSNSTLDMLGASAAERQKIDNLLSSLAASGTRPGDLLVQLLISSLNIVGLDRFPLLGTLIRFTVLQSLSSGRIGHAPARLHGMVIGPPAHGKKLIQLAAKVLNPVCEEVSPTKVSAAGLVGASTHSEGRWVSQPGAIPRASGGVVLLQDAQGWNRSVVSKVAPILQEVMEDGVARDAVSGGIVRDAQASLLFDLNRTSQIQTGGVVVPTSREAAILQVRPVLSRMDLLCEIPVDVERQWDVSLKFYKTMKTGPVSRDDPQWVRDARLLVAALRDRHPEVNLDAVRDLMEQTHQKIQQGNAALFKDNPELGDIPARLAISFARFVSAGARARDSSTADATDVAEAAEFISMKLKFLSMVGVSVPVEGAEGDSPVEWAARYRGQDVETEEVRAAYEKATGRSASERTFRRALQKLGGTSQGRGRYRLPPG